MFLGQYEHNIDDKGRLTIPARYRELLAEGAYISKGYEKPSLMVLPSSHFTKLQEAIDQQNQTDPKVRDLRRIVFGSAQRVDIDKVGRILIPPFLRAQLPPDETFFLVGVGKYFEIWPCDAWLIRNEKLEEAMADPGYFSSIDLSFNA